MAPRTPTAATARRPRGRQIPRSFELMGHVVVVEVVPPARWVHGEDAIGIFEPQRMRIEIVGGLSHSAEAHTYWHEATHAMLYVLSSEHYSNEALVDQLGGLIHQIISTWRA